jgi:N-formylglutamate deformylase
VPNIDPTAPFPLVQRPSRDRERPLVLSIPHAGTIIPDDELPQYALDTTQLLRDGDLYTDELYDGATACGATVISSPYSRFVVDLNRLPGDISPEAVAGATARREPGYYGERGVIWAVTTHAERIYPTPLSHEVYERRLNRYYHPYHNTLARELDRLRETFGYVILLDCHSMPSRATKLHSDPGASRADIVPGDLLGESCAPAVSAAVADYWRDGGYGVRMNHPYRGGGIARRHGAPADGVHAIQVELNRGLYMDETTYERSDGFEKLATDCLGLAQALSTLTMRPR